MVAFDQNVYCNFDTSATKAIAGKDIILAIFDKTGASDCTLKRLKLAQKSLQLTFI